MHHGILPAKVGQNQEKGESEGVTDKSNHFSLKCFKNLARRLLLGRIETGKSFILMHIMI